ncbi:hypothetical protein ACQKQD_30220 [Methylobacterium sp. NPDC080182]|uniref:hypothetical protein n=1 Tax=Methylobacterium sp. NPDC080182 TaxID=3390590 RepID=UPI003D0249B6
MLFLAITLIPLTLQLLHFMTSVQTKSDIRRRILELYVIIGGLSEKGQFFEALVKLRKTMKNSRGWYLIFYSSVSFACFVSKIPELIVKSRNELEKNLILLSDFVIDTHYSVTFDLGMSTDGPNFFYNDDGKSCVARKSALNFVDSKPGHKEKIAAAIRSFSDAQIKWVFALSEIISDTFTFLTVGIAIVISMRVTLFVLSRLANSGLWLVISVFLSLAVALLSPFILIELSTYIAVTSIVTFRSGLPDFFGIDTPTVLNLAIAHASTMTLALLNPESIFAVVLQKALPDSWMVATIFNSLMSPMTISISWDRLGSFAQDLIRFNNFDFEATGLEGIRNWGVGTDLAFSLSYLILSFMLASANNRESVRDYMLDELQEIDSSTGGPILSIAAKTRILMAAILALFVKKS